MIPKLIHQIYWDFSGHNKPPPVEWHKFSRTWKRRFPDWKYMLWNKTKCDHLVRKYYPWFLSKYNSYKFPIQKVDVIRLLILHHRGGLYVDMDYECCRNFEKYLIDHPSPIYIVGSPLSVWPWGEKIQNSLMVSEKDRPFWMEAIKATYKVPKNSSVVHSTGPKFLQKIYNPNKHNVFILPKEKFNPSVNICRTHTCKTSQCFAIHHHQASWLMTKACRKVVEVLFCSKKVILAIIILVIIILVLD